MSRTVKVNGSECPVETLREWLTWRISALKFSGVNDAFQPRNNVGLVNSRAASELQIILDKINDGRIQEIGKADDACILPSCREKGTHNIKIGNTEYIVCCVHFEDQEAITRFHVREMKTWAEELKIDRHR